TPASGRTWSRARRATPPTACVRRSGARCSRRGSTGAQANRPAWTRRRGPVSRPSDTSRNERSVPRLLVIGLDGATLDLVRPWAAAGRLPVLARLMAVGAWGPLRSTIPAATFPAWTSLVTGVNPGRHGVLDFTERVPGTYRVRFVNGSWRRAPALWTRLSAAGRRVAVLTVPATYPPEPIDGVMVSGFDSPLATAIDGSFVHPRAFYADIRRLADSGLLGFRSTPGRGRLAGLARSAALRAIPIRLQGPLLRRLPGAAGRLEGMHRFDGIDWARTVAFSEELDYHPSVWLNV